MCDRVELKDKQIVKSECVRSSLFLFYTLALSLLAFESFLKGLSGRTNKSLPFGAAALLPLTQIHNHAKQGKGHH